MLSIYYGKMENVIYNTSVYFNNVFRGEWLEDPLIIEMIRDVDNSEVLGNGAIKSPVLGVISPSTLSGGVKTLILIYKVPDKIFNASNCGDNCANEYSCAAEPPVRCGESHMSGLTGATLL